MLIRLFILLGLCVGMLFVGGCAEASSENETPIKAADSTEVESRFVTISPAIGVMLQELGFEDSIVGRHSYDSALSRSIPAVGSHLDIDYELLISLEPTDVFFEQLSSEIPDRMVRLAQDHGWQIWSYQLKTLDDIAGAVDDLYLKFVGFPEAEPIGGVLDLTIDPTARFDIQLPSARLAQAWSDIGMAADKAGRVLVLAGVDPPGAMGPGSFHAQLIERLGLEPAIVTGGMWQELDREDIIELAPDSILIFAPKQPSADQVAGGQIGEPEPMSWGQILAHSGGLAELPIPAVEHRRIAIIEHPLGLLPSTSLGSVADEVVVVLEAWAARD